MERRPAPLRGKRREHLAAGPGTSGGVVPEGLVAIAAGAAASSTALIGFGLDSFVEVSSAAVLIWQFRSRVPEDRERLALRLAGMSFFALAAWITVDALRSLLADGDADASPVGIGLAVASLRPLPSGRGHR